MRHKKFSRRQRGALIFLVMAMGLLALDYYAFPYSATISGRALSTRTNGLWVRYTHYFGQKSDAEISALCERLKAEGIRDAYFHVRFIQTDGSLKFHYPEQAQKLIAAVHTQAPESRCLAWVYVGNARGEGAVVLSDPAVRKKMVAEALWLCTKCGFDGVQWDYEICEDGNPDLLALLDETRAALPQGKVLSVAAPMWFPVRAFGWSEDYFSQVAARCDQVAVMCYDTGMLLPRAYVALAAQNVVHVTQAVARGNPHCQMLLGAPTYGKGLRSHNPRAENIANALRGARQGLADPKTRPEVFAGVALFADYTTDTHEWETYHALWASHF
ncbi:glycosyl hydrolase family 18 protein [Armatimonas sp.]|uniref:glycosyl hydrolase family 18 protein n=1 Tax=Armatimonas sp. TaxID=1872638 RepID=UPI00286CCE60|nr:glycosyl hydrolase family 18 protein [Armatimonas sp.]